MQCTLENKTKTGLFFGSFNPVHIGHLAIANYFLEMTDLDEIWFVVSPLNPWKTEMDMPPQEVRVAMLKLAVANENNYKVSDFEKHLNSPSYTYESLRYVTQKYPNNQFVLIIGGDNLDSFQKWRNSDKIRDLVEIYAYPRSGTELKLNDIRTVEAPLIEISSTQIRKWLYRGHKLPFMLTPAVSEYIISNHLYTNKS